jgi:hypothetical protein
MILLRGKWYLVVAVCEAAILSTASRSKADIVIPTNQNGADAEVRESETGTSTPYNGVNRGSNFELATRLIDRTNGGPSDRSSAIYLKFDISGITAADLVANPFAILRMHIGNVNVIPSRQSAPSPADPNVIVNMEYALRGLTNFSLNNWQENTITYYNAPGITPDATEAPNPVNPGEYDFNNDLPELGRFRMPTVAPQNHLAVGSNVDYTESALGPLHELITQGRLAGQGFVTLVVHHGLNGFQADAGLGEAPGVTPTSMLNFNNLFIPKEVTVLNNTMGQPGGLNDTTYDPNTTDLIPAGPGPFLNASNASGEFSPKLILSPVSMQPIDKVWRIDADEVTSVATNWTTEVAPGGVGDKASFSTVITADRTVTIDTPLTLGTVRFDDDNNYTLTGNTLTLQAAGTSPAVIDDLNAHGNGAHTIAAPVVLASNLNITQLSTGALTISGALDNSAGRTITKLGPGPLELSGAQTHGAGAVLTVSAGTANLNANAGSNSARNLTVNANSTTNFAAGQHLAALNVGAGATATVTAGGAKNLVTVALTIAGGGTPTGRLDLTNNAAIIDYTGTSPAATVRAQILAGRGGAGVGAAWTGQGITSSAAAAANAAQAESRSVAYAENASLPLGALTTFRGQPVDSTSILIAFTRTGDANLDGLVNDNDVTIVGASYAPGVAGASWATGDFDYNGFVDDDDVTLLGAFYDPSAPPLAAPDAEANQVAAVPEPSAFLLIAIGALALALSLSRKRASAAIRVV